MKKIIFILGIVLSTHSFAENGTNEAHIICTVFKNIAGISHKLRQNGEQSSDITDKLLRTLAEAEKEYTDDEVYKSMDDATKKEKDEYMKKYHAATFNFSRIAVQQAFTVPIQPTKELKTEVVIQNSKNAYVNCMSNIYERNK